MIIDEAGCTWHQVRVDRGPNGEACIRYECQHARLFQLVQRTKPDAPAVVSYHVEGVPNHWPTPAEALAALRANP